MMVFEGSILFSTSSAILFQGNYWWGPLWLPRSQCFVIPDGDDGVVVKVKLWLCKKNQLEEFVEYNEEEIAKRNERE